MLHRMLHKMLRSAKNAAQNGEGRTYIRYPDSPSAVLSTSIVQQSCNSGAELQVIIAVTHNLTEEGRHWQKLQYSLTLCQRPKTCCLDPLTCPSGSYGGMSTPCHCCLDPLTCPSGSYGRMSTLCNCCLDTLTCPSGSYRRTSTHCHCCLDTLTCHVH